MGGRRKWGPQRGRKSAGGAGRTSQGCGEQAGGGRAGREDSEAPTTPKVWFLREQAGHQQLGSGPCGEEGAAPGPVLCRTWNESSFLLGSSASPRNPRHPSRGLCLLRPPLQYTMGWAASAPDIYFLTGLGWESKRKMEQDWLPLRSLSLA